MGILVAKKYRTSMFLWLADHTYVECGTGQRGWSCCGGKSGGSAFNQGGGSTLRADAIAEPDERAGIRRYLIDGVCHQAANRILFPAQIHVNGARGYGLSHALFGVYGRSSFNNWPAISGDLSDCASSSSISTTKKKRQIDVKLINHAKKLLRRYDVNSLGTLDPMDANLQSFEDQMNILFDNSLSPKKMQGLLLAKAGAESKLFQLEATLGSKQFEAVDFVSQFNEMTEKFQDDAANTLSAQDYMIGFGADRDERIVLADPVAIDKNFGAGTSAAVYKILPPPSLT